MAHRYYEVEGLFFPKSFPEEVVRSALTYTARPGDVFLVSYPKCGTTWLQHIVYLIFTDGHTPVDYSDLSARMVFLECRGADVVDSMPRPGAVKTHLPYHRQPYSEQAKYIYITRTMPVTGIRRIDGLPLCKHFPEETVRFVFSYKPRPDDVFVVTYPKCGTTWMQHIVYYIYNKGQPRKSAEEFSSRTPFFELQGIEAVSNLVRPAAIKTHLPFDKHPYSEEAKCIYVARNPFDCCVSYFHHYKLFPGHDFQDRTFDEYFDAFMEGNVDFGDYFDHLLSWYPHRYDPNVLFLTFEDLKKDVRYWIQKVADFLGHEYGQCLRENPAVLDRIVHLTKFGTMKEVVNPEMRHFKDSFSATPAEKLPRWAQLFCEACGDSLKKPVTGDFIRKGEIGDWRNYFSQDQVKRLLERIAVKTAGSDVMELWKDLDLFE